MRGLSGGIVSSFLALGGPGLLLISIADSSFLILPIANDLLVVLLTSRRHGFLLYYAAMATLGSVIGFFILDLIFRKGGQATIEKHVSRARLDYLKNKIDRRTGWALAIGSLVPPPFPMKPLVAAASALQYPRKKLLGVIAIARFVRFTAEGVVAIFLGTKAMEFANSPELEDLMYALIGLAVLGSAASVYLWIKRSKAAESKG
jgi:membrane protein YqaA with SNARE-associated domain